MGTVKCQTVAGILDELAPKRLAENWDNVGLLVGDGRQKIKKVMVCLDAPEWVVEEAVEKDVDMIVSHHPLIFNGIKRVNTDTATGRKLLKLIKNNIALYCLHTNYDITAGGLNDIFAKELGFTDSKVMEETYREKLFKLVVYVPAGYEDKVMDAMCSAGAGYIGKYSSCTFRTKGIGTFEPQEGAKPFTGVQGRLESTEEFRVETIVPEKLLNKVIKEMLNAHPYEEAAYDIYETKNEGRVMGLGRIAELENETTLSMYAEIVKTSLGADHVRFAGDPNRPIKKVALLNGSGSKYINNARFAGADVLVTGDMQYHGILDALEMGLCIIDAGHYATEKIMIKYIAEYLKGKFQELKLDAEVVESSSNTELLRIL
ncbi:MAG TPA: Nif3-like dinuclear metal center hexameric protein [Clostridia bacterium]|nr:Nif3-like dinuclear metal center hexameric protein [Clostridia bacterium]